MNSETFNLNTVEGIEDVNSFTVKSSTTTESENEAESDGTDDAENESEKEKDDS